MRCCFCHDEITDGLVPITKGFTQPELATCKTCYAIITPNVPMLVLTDEMRTIYKYYSEALTRDTLP